MGQDSNGNPPVQRIRYATLARRFRGDRDAPTSLASVAHSSRVVAVLIALFILPPLATESARSAALTTATGPEEVGMSAERLQRINQMVHRYIDAKEITGAVTIIARRGKVAHFEAQGLMDLDQKTPMRKDAIFRMASMSKPVAGVAILMLVEEGKVRLTDSVSRFIPGFKDVQVAMPKPESPGGSGAARAEGLPSEPGIHSASSAKSRCVISSPTPLGFRAAAPVSAPPGAPHHVLKPIRSRPTCRSWPPARSTFSRAWNGGTALAGIDALGRVVEIASGLTFDQFLKQRIFDPLACRTRRSWCPPKSRRVW